MSAKDKKTIAGLFTVFFLLALFSAGEDNSWIEIFISSTLFSSLYTSIIFVVYKLFTVLFNLGQLIDREEAAIIAEEMLEEKDTKIGS